VGTSLAVVRSLGSGRRPRTPQELEGFEQVLVDQYLLAAVGAGVGDAAIRQGRMVIFGAGSIAGSLIGWELGARIATKTRQRGGIPGGVIRITVGAAVAAGLL
jgi:hypothetical protein